MGVTVSCGVACSARCGRSGVCSDVVVGCGYVHKVFSIMCEIFVRRCIRHLSSKDTVTGLYVCEVSNSAFA